MTEVSEALHVSPEHLSRKFKQDMGVPLKSYLIDKKLQYSRHLLHLGSNVTEAALESGFQNVSYFIQLYKNKYGVTRTNRNSAPAEQICMSAPADGLINARLCVIITARPDDRF